MRRFARVAAFLCLTALLAACGANEAAIYRSYSLQSPNDSGKSVLIDAKQRAILTAPADQVRYPPGQEERLRKVIVCAEPSPDALSAISSTFAASAGGLFPSGEEVQVALSRALSETATQLGQRNATIQLLRDGLYRQCEAYMNGLIDKTYYEQIANKYANAMVTLLAIEELAGKGAKSQKAASEKVLNASANVDLSAGQGSESPEAESAATAAAGQPAAGGDAGGEATAPPASGGGRASAAAAPPVVNVNLPEGDGTTEEHVSTAVNTMVTWFLTKDTVDYCLRGLFAGTQSQNDAFNQAFIEVCKEVILKQMAQQGQIASAYEVSTAGGVANFDDCSASMRAFWKPDGTTINTVNEQKIRTAMRDRGVSGAITTLMNDPDSVEARHDVGAALNLAACN
jgi:hypothetical protein